MNSEKVAIITRASQDIGNEVARGSAKDRYNVVLIARTEKKIFIFFALFFSLLSSLSFAAKTYSPICPKEIDVKEKTTVDYPGWRTLNIEPHHYFSNVRMYIDEPEKKADLVPDNNKIKNKNTTWRFNPADKIFMVCEYTDTSIHLTKQLLDRTTKCTIQFEKYVRNKNGGFVPEKIICQHE